MRVVMMIKGDREPGHLPSEELLAQMGKYNERRPTFERQALGDAEHLLMVLVGVLALELTEHLSTSRPGPNRRRRRRPDSR